MPLAHKRLLEIIHYDPKTGKWTWLIDGPPGKSKMRKGTEAGRICKRTGYRLIGLYSKNYRSGRLAWFYINGYWPENIIDHKDRNRSNDKWSNLRHTSHQCNNRNRCLMPSNKTGVVGVRKRGCKWLSSIWVNKKQVNLGRYDDFKSAVKVRWSAEVKYNFPNCNTTSTAYNYLNNQIERIR